MPVPDQSPSSTSQRGHSIARRLSCAFAVAVVVALAVAVVENLLPKSFARWAVASWWSGSDGDPGAAIAERRQIAAWASGGNVFLRFIGFDRSSASYAGRLYFHLNYDLAPARAFVADRGTVINDGAGILAAGFSPDSDWLARHGVAVVVDVERSDAGVTLTPQRVASVPKVSQKAPPWDGPAMLRALLYLLLILASGWACLTLVSPGRRPIIEWTALVFALGCGSVGTALTWASLAGARPSIPALVTIAIAAIGVLAARGRSSLPARPRRQIAKPTSRARKIGAWAALAVIIAAIGVVTLDAALFPASEWDAFSIWQFKAKMFAHESLAAARNDLSDRTLSYSHVRYPPLVPMLSAGAFEAAGTDDDRAARLYLPLLAIALVGFVYAELSPALGHAEAMLVAAVLAACPALLRWGGRGTADLPLAAFCAGSVIYAARWLTRRDPTDLRLAAILCAFAGLTKNEGLPLIGIELLVLVAMSTGGAARLRAAAWLAGAAAVVVGPWWLYARTLPATDENYAARLTFGTILHHTNRLGPILAGMCNGCGPSHFGLLWILLLLSAIFAVRSFRRRAVIAVWLILALQCGAYAAAYLVSPWPVPALINSTVDRLLLQAAPLAGPLIGWHWASGVNRADGVSE